MKVSIETLEQHVQQRLSPKRFNHTMGVVEMAKRLAVHYEADEQRASVAALLHDVMKESPLQDMQAIVGEAKIPVDEEMLGNGALLHGPAGAAYAQLRLHVEDTSICEAIRVHTMGSTHMSLLDKIIFLADYIEPNRDFPGVEELRALAFQDINEAVIRASKTEGSTLGPYHCGSIGRGPYHRWIGVGDSKGCRGSIEPF